jgi:hypothetical protein
MGQPLAIVVVTAASDSFVQGCAAQNHLNHLSKGLMMDWSGGTWPTDGVETPARLVARSRKYAYSCAETRLAPSATAAAMKKEPRIVKDK